MKRQQGAALLVLMMILLAASSFLILKALNTSHTQHEQRRMQTMTMLNEARDALIGFAIANGRLPCPAPATTATGVAGAGLEPNPVVAGGCVNVAGVLPWATLGINETDAWGNRYTYRVTPEFTRTVPQAGFPSCVIQPLPPPLLAAFALCSLGNMTILNTGGGSSIATNAPIVVLSHGKNGNGAYNTQGTQLPLGADVDEQDNQLTAVGTATANTNFISKTPTATFDDHVIWLPFDASSILYKRMVAAGKL